MTPKSRFLLDLHGDQAVRSRLLDSRLERFIGEIYRLETELREPLRGMPGSGSTRSAVLPLGPEHAKPGTPETWPFGL